MAFLTRNPRANIKPSIVQVRLATNPDALPTTWLEITQDEGTYYLVRHAIDCTVFGDTRHASLEAAKQQAAAEFEVMPQDWTQAT